MIYRSFTSPDAGQSPGCSPRTRDKEVASGAGKAPKRTAGKGTGRAVVRKKAGLPHQITIFEYAAMVGVALLPDPS